MEPVSSAVGLYQGVQFIRDVGTQSYRIFFARSATDWHLQQLLRAEAEATYWNSHVQNLLTNASGIPEARLETIKINASEFNSELRKYRKRVRRWCKRLSTWTDDASDGRSSKNIAREEKSSAFLPLEEREEMMRDREEDYHRIGNQGRVSSSARPVKIGRAHV